MRSPSIPSFPPFFSFLAIAAVAVSAVPSVAAAAEPDSIFAKPLPQLTVHLEQGVTRNAISIEPRSDGMAAVTAPDGTKEYIALYKIRRIEDANGADRTSEVVRQGHRLSVASPKSGPPPWKKLRLGAAPRSVCGSYLITDFALMFRTDSRSEISEFDHTGSKALSLDLGYARNVGDASSVGGTAFAEGDDARTRSGLRLRFVRWLAPNVSIDIAPGVILLADEEGSSKFQGPGLSSQVGLSVNGRYGLVAQVSSAKRQYPSWSSHPNSVVRETDWHVGARLGGGHGIMGLAVFGALLVAALSGWGWD